MLRNWFLVGLVVCRRLAVAPLPGGICLMLWWRRIKWSVRRQRHSTPLEKLPGRIVVGIQLGAVPVVVLLQMGNLPHNHRTEALRTDVGVVGAGGTVGGRHVLAGVAGRGRPLVARRYLRGLDEGGVLFVGEAGFGAAAARFVRLEVLVEQDVGQLLKAADYTFLGC